MRVLIASLILCLPLIGLGQERRAQSLIEKDKRLDAYDLLWKAIQKDSLASSEHFLLATLFIDEDFRFYDIDSAYHHIILARENFKNLEVKLQERLEGNGFNLQVYDTLQKNIEAVGFRRAKSLGREEDYISFIELFPEALQLDSAIVLRDADAYRQASRLDTYQSYQHFFEKYPGAIAVNEAKKRYHRLLFEAKTASGKLAAYKQFLLDFPETWERRAAERQIFRITTGQNTISAYRAFVEAYPQSEWAEKARLFAYNLGDSSEKQHILTTWDLSQHARDSLALLNQLTNNLLLLTHNGTTFEVIKGDGKVVLSGVAQVADINKCRDVGPLLLVLKPSENQLINLNSEALIVGDFSNYSEVSRGFIKLNFRDGEEIIHLNGLPTTGKRYRAATLAGGFIVYKENNHWGLESITGIHLTDPVFDTVYQFNEHLVFNQSGQWGILPVEQLYPLLDKEQIVLSLPYDSLAPVRNNELFARLGNQSGLFDSKLQPIVPLGEAHLELLENGYFLETNDSLLDSRLGNVWYSNLRSNDDWTIGVRAGGTDLFYRGRKIAVVEEADLLGLSAVKAKTGDKVFCYFDSKAKIELNEGDDIRPVRKMGENSVVRHYLLTDQRGRQAVINEEGKRIKLPLFDRLIDLGEDYMIFSVKGLVYNILDNKGKLVLEKVDAATSLDSGYISFLANGKFGLLNSRNKTLIEARYDKPLRRYDDERFIVEEDGNLGLIDRHDSLYIDAKYEEILPVNDSIAVLKANFRWTFWNINQGKIILDNVSDYWEYKTDAGTYFKIFKGIGYGIWRPAEGMLLNPTYDEVSLKASHGELVFIGEKWVEEADLVILLYYDGKGQLRRKSVLTTRQYESLQCKPVY